MNLRWMPNLITVFRIALVAPLVFTLLHREYHAALWLAFIAGLSDGVDGYLAKRFGWTTWLGSLLDPVADKLLLLAGFAVLTVQGLVPDWLFWLMMARDLAIVIGAYVYYRLVGHVEGKPSRLSKLNTVLQITLLLWVLMTQVWPQVLTTPGLVPWLVGFTAATTAGSGIHYVWVWAGMARRERRQRDDA